MDILKRSLLYICFVLLLSFTQFDFSYTGVIDLVPMVDFYLQEFQPWNVDICYDPKTELLDDKLFSPELAHVQPEFHYQPNSESDSRYGLQYGTNETNISDFLNSVVNWDELPYEEPNCQQWTYPSFNVQNSALGSDIDSELANIKVSNSSYIILSFVHSR